MTYCPECNEPLLSPNATSCENCDKLIKELAQASKDCCEMCNFGGFECDCGLQDDEDWDDEDNDYDDEDDFEYALGNCGMMADGFCGYAGSEYCDFDCPFNE